ncbi:K02A2.6-like [Cordylochernes scorpioides]|uniref:K02A2.6-like n=1 Tax=Cordylochernes scorpioides TaxID=51811 RepID=A0ABY6LDV5_9ARAC|nr:K02A2.6-like [Cordylochernes scorpioides]
MKQKEDESFNDFLTRIKLQIANCKYAVISDELLKDRIVVEIINNEIRERLLSEADLNLEKATQICIACENATNQMKHVLSDSDKQVAVTKVNSKKREDRKEPRKENTTNQSHKIIENCRNCGRSHKINQCPAYQKRCNKCKKLNHFANLCRSQITNSYKVRQIVGSPEPEMNQEFVIQSVENTNLTEDWYEEVKIKGKKVNMKLDTAERAVQTAKNLIRKCLDSGQEVELALLNFYNTPRDGLPSPAQCLFSRRTRTLLPTSTHQLEPEIQKGHTQNLRNKRKKQKTHHDKTAKTTRSFKEGEKIMLKQHHREWIPARVTQEVAPRSYKVQTPTGEYRRNSSFMRHTNLESPKQQRRRIPEIPKSTLPEGPGPSGDKEQAQVSEELNTSPRPFSGQEPRSDHQNAEHKNGTLPITRSGRIIKPPKRFEE